MVPDRAYDMPPLVPKLRHTNPVHMIPLYYFRFTLILSSHLRPVFKVVYFLVGSRTKRVYLRSLQYNVSHYGPGIDSASNRNEYQECSLGVKTAGAYG